MKTQVAIVGGGPGGTAAAMFLRELGIDSVLIEKEAFPRYHIGESMTGECGALVRDLGLQDGMSRYSFPVKKGLTVYGKDGNNPWFVPVMGRDENGKLYENSTWQVRRSDFDKMLLDEALSRGTDLVDGKAIKPLLEDDGAVHGVRVELKNGKNVNIESEVLLDCSGQTTFLANAGVTGPKYRGNYDRQIAIFSQVRGARRDEGANRDDTLIFYQDKYHWAWFIPLDDEIVSVGIVTPAAYFSGKKESKRDFLVREMRELNPALGDRMEDVEVIDETRSVVNYSYQVRDFCGKGFMCVGDAHRFIDPIFSFGLFETMKEAQLAAPAIRDYLEGVDRDLPNPFARHENHCETGLDIVEDAVDTFWEYPLAFALFVHKRYTDELIDLLAGRVFQQQPSPAVEAMRKLMRRDRSGGDSMPQGSRFNQA